MASPISTYSFINAKLRARISKLLSDEYFEQLIQSHNITEAVQLLRDTEYRELETIYTQTGDLKLAELELWTREVAVYVEIQKFVSGPVRDFWTILALRYEIDNLKNVLRIWFDRAVRNRDTEYISGYLYRKPIVNDLAMDRVLAADDLSEVAEALRRTPYRPIILANAEEVVSAGSLFTLEIALDRHYYHLLAAATTTLTDLDKAAAKRLIGVEVDLLNLNWIIRFKQLYNLPLEQALSYTLDGGQHLDRKLMAEAYGAESAADMVSGLVKSRYPGMASMLKLETQDASGRLLMIERILRHILTAEVQHALAGYPFTVGTILAYFVKKRQELSELLTILNAKLYRISPERIKSLL